MARLLPAPLFPGWLEGFLPDIVERRPATLFEPASVSDRSDGKIAHLDGLNLSRAWCWSELALHSTVADPRHATMAAAAARHLETSLPHVAGNFMGEHWLATFAVLALWPQSIEGGA